MALRTHFWTRTPKVALVLLLGSTLALAAPHGGKDQHGAKHHGHRGGLFARLDQNGDGKVVQAEAQAAAAKHFTEMDQNGDGSVTRDEETMKRAQPGHAQRTDQHFARMDKNGDGKVERAETRMPEAAFAGADANKDGKLTKAELAASFEKMSEARRAARFAEFDTNSDGKIVKAEALAQANVHFAKLDGNKDGQVTREEAHAAFAAKRRGHGSPEHNCRDSADEPAAKTGKGKAS